jgi:hypothetical protein
MSSVSFTSVAEKTTSFTTQDCPPTHSVPLIAFVLLTSQFTELLPHAAHLTDSVFYYGWIKTVLFYNQDSPAWETTKASFMTNPQSYDSHQCGEECPTYVVLTTFRSKDEIALDFEGVNRSRGTCESVPLRVNGAGTYSHFATRKLG